MKFYRIDNSTNLKEVGAVPQRGEMSDGLHKDDPRHFCNQPDIGALSEEVYIPSFRLRNKAKLTDVISFPINSDWIVSEKFKNIFEAEKIEYVQFVPIYLFKKDEANKYYLLRTLKLFMECIDFSKTTISIMKTTWEEEKRLLVKDLNEFNFLIESTHLPYSIKISEFRISEKCMYDFIRLDYTYGEPTLFISERFKDTLLQNKITGIRYMEIDEVL
ncbi:imm11 family protein [Phnomibacter sp. MR]|uniref:imm11 family protein n=1 Tax=Phnomibacter sp. MR TaxID=3042318 RepID=UPI003A802303